MQDLQARLRYCALGMLERPDHAIHHQFMMLRRDRKQGSKTMGISSLEQLEEGQAVLREVLEISSRFGSVGVQAYGADRGRDGFGDLT